VARKVGDLQGQDDRDHEWGAIEYGAVEETAFLEMSRTGVDAAGVHVTHGDPERSHRMSSFMRPHFGYGDELRVLFRDGGQVWDGAALFREPESRPSGLDEVAFAGSLSAVFAAGVRTGLLARTATTPRVRQPAPTVLIIGADDQIRQTSMGAEVRCVSSRAPLTTPA
jgi:hypothetical protein